MIHFTANVWPSVLVVCIQQCQQFHFLKILLNSVSPDVYVGVCPCMSICLFLTLSVSGCRSLDLGVCYSVSHCLSVSVPLIVCLSPSL